MRCVAPAILVVSAGFFWLQVKSATGIDLSTNGACHRRRSDLAVLYESVHGTSGTLKDRRRTSAAGGILLQKSFWGDERKFSGTLTRVARGDVRDHVAPRKNDHRPAERRDDASQRYSSLKITFREIFGVVRFSTFATTSADSGHSLLIRSPYRHGRLACAGRRQESGPQQRGTCLGSAHCQ